MAENSGQEYTPWVCLKGRDNDYDGYYYELIGNREGLKKLGENLIALSNSNELQLLPDTKGQQSFVKKYDVVLDKIAVAQTSFDDFKNIARKVQEKESKDPMRGFVIGALFISAIILFIIGVINGLNSLYNFLF